jgi:tetratricopeptide (TPR) repeat protein
MRSRIIKLFGVFTATIIVSWACVPTIPPETSANSKFYDRQYTEAAAGYKPLVDLSFNSQDINYILFLMNYALSNYYSGNYDEASRAFWSAYLTNENQLAWGDKVLQLFKKQSHRIYKLKKRELMLLHYYLAMCFMAQNDYNKARIEFGKVHLIEEQRPRLPLVALMEGQCYELLDNIDEAIVSNKIADQLAKDKQNNESFAFPSLALASLYLKRGDIGSAQTFLDKYNTFERNGSGMEYSLNDLRSLKTKLIITLDVSDLADIGFCKIFADDRFLGKAYLTDIFKPGKNAGEFVRETLKELPITIFNILEALAGINEGDPDKYWYFAPQGVFLHIGYLPQDSKDIVVEFYDRKGKAKADFLYDLGALPTIKIGDIFLLPLRYHHERFSPYYTYNFSDNTSYHRYQEGWVHYIKKEK